MRLSNKNIFRQDLGFEISEYLHEKNVIVKIAIKIVIAYVGCIRIR